MLKYKSGLVILLVIIFAVPSKGFPLPLQEIKSPIFFGHETSCTATNVEAETDLLVDIQLVDDSGAIIVAVSDVTLTPGNMRFVEKATSTTVPIPLRCVVTWIGHRQDVSGAHCTVFVVTDLGMGYTCLRLQ